MRKRWVVLLSFAGVIVGFFVWVSRPEPSDRAELTDTCSFPTITNAQYSRAGHRSEEIDEPIGGVSPTAMAILSRARPTRRSGTWYRSL